MYNDTTVLLPKFKAVGHDQIQAELHSLKVEKLDVCIKHLFSNSVTYVTGFAKTDHNITFGQLHFIGQLIATHIHYPYTVVLMGLVDWSAFLMLVLNC